MDGEGETGGRGCGEEGGGRERERERGGGGREICGYGQPVIGVFGIYLCRNGNSTFVYIFFSLSIYFSNYLFNLFFSQVLIEHYGLRKREREREDKAENEGQRKLSFPEHCPQSHSLLF